MSADTSLSTLNIERLDLTNYATWAWRMQCVLTAKALWEAIEGPTATSVEGAPTAVDSEIDRKAKAFIGLCVASQHLPTVMRAPTAKDAWAALKTYFKSMGPVLKLRLRRDLNNLKMGTAEPVLKYLARAKELRDTLRDAGLDVDEQETLMTVLTGLPAAYDTAITLLTAPGAEPTLDTIVPTLLQVEERARGGRPDRSGDTAFMAAFTCH